MLASDCGYVGSIKGNFLVERLVVFFKSLNFHFQSIILHCQWDVHGTDWPICHHNICPWFRFTLAPGILLSVAYRSYVETESDDVFQTMCNTLLYNICQYRTPIITINRLIHCSVNGQISVLGKDRNFSFLLLPNSLWSNYRFMSNKCQGYAPLAWYPLTKFTCILSSVVTQNRVAYAILVTYSFNVWFCPAECLFNYSVGPM